MNFSRIKASQQAIVKAILIKKKENLLYLTGRSFLHGYVLVLPRKHAESNAERRGNKSVIFLGDGLERIEGIHSDFLKNVGMYVPKGQTLEVYGDFTYAEVKYIKFKNPKLKLKVLVKRDPVDYQRMIKEPGEIALVKKSMQIVERVFGEVKKKLHRRERSRPFPTERELADFIQSLGLKMGAEELSFPAIVAAGTNAATPHHVPSSKRLRVGESIIIDFGFKYKNYCSDFTRTVFLKKVPKRLEIAYNQVEKAYNESINFCNLSASAALGISPQEGRKVQPARTPSPSEERGRGEVVTGNDVYQRAVDVLAEKHLDKYFIHSLGHGTGLEIHELPNLSPNSKDIMKDGMVFSIEPGVYIKDLGGIRIEDLVYLEKGKVKKFINVSTKLTDNIIST